MDILIIRHGSFLLATLLICCVFVVDDLSASEQETVADVMALVRQNARLPKTLRVTWEVENSLTPQGKRRMKKLADALAAAAKLETVSDEWRDHAIRYSAQLNQRLDNDATWAGRYDYWTDFSSFQNRAARNPRNGGVSWTPKPPPQVFPDRLPNFEEIPQDFGDVVILSLGEATGGFFRSWQASGEKPYAGSVAVENPWYQEFPPPLVIAPPEWGKNRHPVDNFIRFLETGQNRVLGTVILNGREHILLFTALGTESMRVFLSMEQGAVPSRIEHFLWVLDEKQLESRIISDLSPGIAANSITTCEIQSHQCNAGEYFYPASGEFIDFTMAASPADAVSAVHPEVGANERMAWKYIAVECDREMAPEDFRLSFPKDTVVIDHAKKLTFVTGDLEGSMRQIADGALEFRRPSWGFWSIAGLISLPMALLFVAFLAYKRWKSR